MGSAVSTTSSSHSSAASETAKVPTFVVQEIESVIIVISFFIMPKACPERGYLVS